MKYIYITFFFVLVLPLSSRVAAQDSINPYNTQLPNNILLQNTDVYYNPFDPPGLLDSAQNLSNQSIMIRDSNGISLNYPKYGPIVYGSGTHPVMLQNWHPHGDTLGPTAVWQRFFTAKRDASGNAHDIVAGGGAPGTRVTIRANEDVDFRASGRIKLKSGFHVKPGARFHAYTEPAWDTAVFADEFDDTAKFHNQWHVGGHGGNDYGQGVQCDNDTNVYLDTDYQAHDGHALDIIIRTTLPYTYKSPILGDDILDMCQNISQIPYDTDLFIFSSGIIRSCPFPFTQRDTAPLTLAYMHMPYGKYEIREKIPHMMHHTNNWGGAWNYGFEYDLNETDYNGNMDTISPGYSHSFQYGPFQGVFSTLGDTVIFISSQPEWCQSNNPNTININNVAYQVQFVPHHGMDTLMAINYTQNMGWPLSLTSSHDTYSFYYSINNPCIADTMPWRVDTDSHGKWRLFSTARLSH